MNLIKVSLQGKESISRPDSEEIGRGGGNGNATHMIDLQRSRDLSKPPSWTSSLEPRIRADQEDSGIEGP